MDNRTAIMLRVLIADDSITSRQFVAEVLKRDPQIQVVGQAQHGAEAVQMAVQLRPDLILMDAHMPKLDGFAATEEIMIVAPTPIIILTATTDVTDLKNAMRALRAGALTMLQKPVDPRHTKFDGEAEQLITTVKAMATVKVVRRHRTLASSSPLPPGPRLAIRPRVLAIASSTGGPVALQRLMSGLPRNFPLPILVVQHISRGFTNGFADWLQSVCPFDVNVAENQESILAGKVYLAPEDRHLTLEAPGRVRLSDAPASGGFRPSADYLFESAAHVYGSATIAVILTGMGRDGVVGLQSIKKAKGYTIAQDEESCVVFGMPAAAIAAGVTDAVLPLEAISQRLVQMTSTLYGHTYA